MKAGPPRNPRSAGRPGAFRDAAAGEINRAGGEETPRLLGPGCWGSASPDLGIPVNFHQIKRATAIRVIDAARLPGHPEIQIAADARRQTVKVFSSVEFPPDSALSTAAGKWIGNLFPLVE